MKWRSTVLLLVLALGLGVFVVFYDSNQSTTGEATAKAKRLFDLDASKIGWIEVEHDGTTQHFDRVTEGEGDAAKIHWQMTAPVSDRADRLLLDALADRIARLESKRTLTPGKPGVSLPSDADAGLASARFRIRFDGSANEGSARGAAGPVTLIAGREAAGAGGLFLRVDGAPSLYVTGREIVEGLDRPVSEWRDHALFSVSTLDIGEAVIERPAGTLRFTRKGEDWRLASPVEDDAQGSKVQSLLAAVTGARVEAFYERGAVAEAARLESPVYRVNLSSRAGTPAGELLVGASVAGDPNHFYASVTGRDGIVEIGKSALTDLDGEAQSFRSLRLFTFNQWDVTGVDLEQGTEKVSMEKNGTEWKAVTPADLKPTPGAVDETIRQLAATDALSIGSSIGATPGNLSEFGLDPPVAKAVLRIAGGVSETVGFGKPAPEAGTIYAIRDGRPYVLVVRATLLDRFSRKIHEAALTEPPAEEHSPSAPSGAGAISPG